MQWNQIKSLFILCFLVLNIYLVYLVLDKQNEADIGVIERDNPKIEEQLESEDITYKDLPTIEDEESFLSVEQKKFDSKNKKSLESMSNQETSIIDDTMILSKFKKPIKIPDKPSADTLDHLVTTDMLYADEYNYWGWNEEYNVLMFFQEKDDRPIYFNRSGLIIVFLNDDNEAIAYTQTMLGEAEEEEEKKSLIQPIKAIETLYLENQLNSGEEVTDMKMGYHTRVPLSDGVQVFVPTWKVNIDSDRNYFVNAIEGFTFSGNDSEFLLEVFESNAEIIRTYLNDDKEDKDVSELILNELNERLENSSGSEE